MVFSDNGLCDDDWMRRCFVLAQRAAEEGDAAAGAVIVCGGAAVAEGVEATLLHQDITAHAELLAVQAACRVLRTRDLSGCTLYTTTEPCFLCSYVLRECRVSRVVIGTPVEGIGGVTSAYPILTAADIPGWGPPPVVAWNSTFALL